MPMISIDKDIPRLYIEGLQKNLDSGMRYKEAASRALISLPVSIKDIWFELKPRCLEIDILPEDGYPLKLKGSEFVAFCTKIEMGS